MNIFDNMVPYFHNQTCDSVNKVGHSIIMLTTSRTLHPHPIVMLSTAKML